MKGWREEWLVAPHPHITVPIAFVDIYRGVFILIMKIDCTHLLMPLSSSLYYVPFWDNYSLPASNAM
jgi:hypothetical protein